MNPCPRLHLPPGTNRQRTLGLLIEVARQHAQDLADAQWDVLRKGAGDVPANAAAWPEASIRLAVRLLHWGGGSWGLYLPSQGDVRAMTRIYLDRTAVEDAARGGRSGARFLPAASTRGLLAVGAGPGEPAGPCAKALDGRTPAPLPPGLRSAPPGAWAGTVFLETKDGYLRFGPAVPGGGASAASPGTVDWTRVPRAERALHAMRALVERHKLPPNGAAGLVGNFLAESEALPSRIEGSRPETPMRAKGFAGRTVDFTADQVMRRSKEAGIGPLLPGVGLAQWTSPPRRAGLFAAGPQALLDMDGQIDYAAQELRTGYRKVEAVLRKPGVGLDEACDEVTYLYEGPGSIHEKVGKTWKLLPRSHPKVQAEFERRRRFAREAQAVWQKATGP